MNSPHPLRWPIGQALLALTFLTLAIAPLHAATINWSNASGGDWNVAANWNSGAGPVPGSADDAVITLAGTYTVRVTGSLSVGSLSTAAGVTLRMEGNNIYGGGQLTVASGFTNNGTIELSDVVGAYGAVLAVTSGTLVNPAGKLIDVQAGAGGSRSLQVELDNHGTVNVNGPLSLTRSNAAHVNESDGTINLSGGDLQLGQSGTPSSFTNSGTITVGTGRTWTISGGTFNQNAGSLGGGGAMVLNSVTAVFNTAFSLGALTMNFSTVTFATAQSTASTDLTIYYSTVNGPGVLTNATGKTLVVLSSTINAALVNQGTVVWRGACTQNGGLTAASGSTLRMEGNNIYGGGQLTVASGFTNNGTIELSDVVGAYGAVLAVTSGTLVNPAGKLIDVQAGAGGSRSLQVELDNHGTVNVNGPLSLTRSNAAHVNESDGTINLSGGDLQLGQSGTPSSFTNSGTITVGTGRTWTISGGTIRNAAGGILRGGGTLNVAATAFTNDGIVNPGASAGILSVTGNMPQTSTAVLNVEIGGATVGTGYDRLAVSGSATLTGTLNISTIGGFTPSPGDQFRIMTCASRTGKFDLINGVSLGGGISLEPHYDATGITLLTVAQTWVRLLPVGEAPDARDSHSAAYDPSNNRMVVFGGLSDAGPLNDTRVLTNANGQGGIPTWIRLTPTGGPPAARAHHSAVYDPASNRMMVYGGDDATGGSPAMYNDVWVLTNADGLGGAPGWAQLTTSGGPPTTRTQHSAVYDAGNNRMIVFGGNPTAGSCASGLNDVWVLSNANGLGGPATWIQLSPSGGPPSARRSHNAVYDAATNRMTIFGGDETCSESNNEVWMLDHANGLGGTPSWSQLSPTGTTPTPWSLHSGVYDPTNNSLTCFGGQVADSASNLTLVLSGANGAAGTPNWADHSPTSLRPATRSLHSAVQDAANHRMVIFAGLSDSGRLRDVWVLEQSEGRVVDVAPAPQPVATNALGFSRPLAPNPSRGSTRFAVAVPTAQSVDLSIFDLAGRRVAVLHHGMLEAGEHAFEWRGVTESGDAAAAGFYLVRFRGGGVNQTRRLLLIR
jgi:hypothetical protein